MPGGGGGSGISFIPGGGGGTGTLPPDLWPRAAAGIDAARAAATSMARFVRPAFLESSRFISLRPDGLG
jgi:hypothetical protein